MILQSAAIADRIIASASFGKSKTYANLLRYLIERTESGEVPKEVTIGREVFGKQDFDPSESTLVRVYVYNLRKKLTAYYEEEGRDESSRLRIPKGSYAVTIENRSPPIPTPPPAIPGTAVSPPPPASPARSRWLSVLLGLSLGAIIAALFLYRPADINPFFADLMDNDRPDMLVLGDMFVYQELDTARGINRSVRNPRINSKEEFRDRYPELARPGVVAEPRGYTYLISNAPRWIQAVDRVFGGRDYTTRLRTRLRATELREYDFTVVGMTKTIGPFRSFFGSSRLQYSGYDEYTITHPDGRTERFRPEGSSSDHHTDYGVVARFPGPSGNVVQLFTGLWDSATTHSIDLLTDPELQQTVEARLRHDLGELPVYYEVFFRVTGDELTQLGYEIIYTDRVDPAAVGW